MLIGNTSGLHPEEGGAEPPTSTIIIPNHVCCLITKVRQGCGSGRRAVLYAIQDGECFWNQFGLCSFPGEPMITTKQIKKMSRGERKAERQRMVSIEHLTELYRGGDHGFQNVVLAHRKCNQERNSRDQRGNELRVLRSRLYHYFGIPMSETQFLVR